MHPELFHIGPMTIYSYGVMLAAGVLTGSWLMAREAARRFNFKADLIYDWVVWMVVAGVIGARLFYVALNWQIYMQDPLEILMIQHGGLAWQGSFIVGGLSGYFFLRRHNLPIRPMLDLAAPYVALGQVFGRMGCFLNGCCYGRPVSWGVQFPFDDNPLHPTQLYASGALFLIFLFLMWRKQQPHYAGQIFVWYLVLMAFQRGVIQFARYDYEPWFAGLGVFQWVAVGIMGLGFVLHWRWHRDSKG